MNWLDPAGRRVIRTAQPATPEGRIWHQNAVRLLNALETIEAQMRGDHIRADSNGDDPDVSYLDAHYHHPGKSQP